MAVVFNNPPTIDLYTHQSPDGIKVSITLEELGLPYQVHNVDIKKHEHKDPTFTAINPNGRIPALTDAFPDGKQIKLFESGSILQYLVDRYDVEHKISYPKGTREAVEVNNWLFFQNAGVGPMQHEAHHFVNHAPEGSDYAAARYTNETRRLYGVLDKHLADSASGWLVGDKCTIADLSLWGWVASAEWAGVDISEFPHLREWELRVLKRDAVEKGRHVPIPHKTKNL